MVLLLVEIGLTVAAWKRGWKWWSLLPLAASFFAGMIFGAVSAGTNGPRDIPFALAITTDILIITALVAMVARGRRGAKYEAPIKGMACPDCGETFPGQLTLAWHRDSAHGYRQASGPEAKFPVATGGQGEATSPASEQASPNKGGDA
jgi:hypothetical protein